MSKVAVFPGSFSPFTIGHEEVVRQALPMFDKIIIALGINTEKKEYFSLDQRKKWIEKIYCNNDKIEISNYEGLTINFCKEKEASYIIRGIRDTHDFQFEKRICHMNKSLNNKIETIFFITPVEVSHISSSLIREIHKNGGDVKMFLPKEVKL